jgi:type II secretory pathway component PulC
MDVTTQRRCLTTLAGGLLLAAVGAVAWSVSGIAPTAKTATEGVPSLANALDDSFSQRTLSDAELNMALRHPLTDPPPPKPRPVAPRVVAPAPQPPPKLQLTLVGTIIESGKSLAIIADSQGAFDVKGVGESLELSPAGVSVQRIDSEQVELQYQGKTSTVKLDRDAKMISNGRRPGKVKRRDR